MSSQWMHGPGRDGHEQRLGGPATAVFPIRDASQVGEARRAAEALAADARLGDSERGTLAIIVTEAATNLARHARAGRLCLTPIGDAEGKGIEVIALDEGPGISNVGRALEDGFSTGGTSGHGLGAMRRMASEFDIYSRSGTGPGVGTVLVARVWSAGATRAAAALSGSRLRAGVVCVPLAGERACGDGWAILHQRERTLAVVVDGLGHGTDAALATSEAIRVVRGMPEASPSDLVHAAHGALRATRGAAMAVAAIHDRSSSVAFAGVGNISAAIHSATASRSLASHNGTVGHVMRKVQEFHFDWPADAVLVIHTDGINTRWKADSYPGLLRQDPALLAGVLLRDAARARDDATVLALGRPAR